MRISFLKKGLVIVIIELLICMSVLSNVSSKDVSISKDKILEDNYDMEPLDDYEEIITLIDGYIWFEDYKIFSGLFIKKIELWNCGDLFSYLKISGYKKPLFPLDDSKFDAEPKHIIASRFIGWIFHDDQFYCSVRGIAIGNIEWS